MEAELKEGLEDALGLYMNLDARPDSSSFEDWKYSSSQQIRYETSHVCSFITHIVGLRSHPAMVFSEHELVTLVRYPQCPRHMYAIKVFNSTSMEVGYLHDEASAVLSPLIDAQMINLEENITQSIFGTTLCLTGEPRTNPETNEGKRDKEKGRIKKLGTLEPPKEVIKAKLFDHQKEGLWWLVNKENSDELPPFWEMKDGLYVNVLTRHRTNRKPEPLHGGIFADD
ncbi:hypothetical protein POTOM_052377 [Populus tomentosa]|uniref:HIRAN domain-containing protein n=1 Tax=Populus tomentosa TaxID=118781 RepID=A0A8X8C096_POPTO|nr:hypothetical protein POTOM_052377 [Populus tomentosa]